MKRLSRNTAGFGAIEGLLIVVIVALVGFVGWYVWHSKNNTNKAYNSASSANNSTQTATKQTSQNPVSQEKTLSKGDFGNNGDFGTFQAKGYATTVKRDDCPGEGGGTNCPQVDYIFFNITKTENSNIFTFLKNNAGNSYVEDKAVGVGCLANGTINYMNSSDANGRKQYTISKDDTTKIMAASTSKPITLEIEKLKLSGGSGAPACTSLFTTFKVLE